MASIAFKQWLAVAFVALLDTVLLSLCLSEHIKSHHKFMGAASGTTLVFRPQFTAPVAMSVGPIQHYNVEEPDSHAEWEKLIPAGGHLVHLQGRNHTGDIQKYTVTMLHQFQCLNAIYHQYNQPQDAQLSPLTTHCINYLRQSILCHLNIGLESATNVWGTVARTSDYVCRDWTELYRAVEQNQDTFKRQYSPSNP